ncbi:MAG: nitroreductase [Pseudomonadota bacterium]
MNDIADALKSRISTRHFLSTPIPEETVRDLLEEARWSPSGGNLQPWRVYVVLGDARDRLVETVKQAITAGPFDDESELAVYPKGLKEPYRSRRYDLGEAMYELLGIPREDKAARLMHLAKNFELFGAPVGLFFSVDRMFDKGQWAHLGMFMQSIALAAHSRGLATCMQEAWITRGKTVSTFLGVPEDHQFYCGMALGHADTDAPVNTLRSERAAVDDFATFMTE